MSLSPSALELVGAAKTLGLPVSVPQAETLSRYEGLLRGRGVDLGLIAEGDRGRIRDRHVLDCLRAAAVVRSEDRVAYDLGSGAGLPGVVVAVARPFLRLILVEARLRRVAFLELVASELGLPNVSVLHARAEGLKDPADLCFARAFSSLDESWRIGRRLLRSGGRLVYFAGEGACVPDEPPEGAGSCVAVGPMLESSGPLVIMTRQ